MLCIAVWPVKTPLNNPASFSPARWGKNWQYTDLLAEHAGKDDWADIAYESFTGNSDNPSPLPVINRLFYSKEYKCFMWTLNLAHIAPDVVIGQPSHNFFSPKDHPANGFFADIYFKIDSVECYHNSHPVLFVKAI